MKILILAPHPFYQERGTPIAVALLLKTLSASGHTVDVLTYAEGDEFNPPPSVKIHRARRPPFVSGVRPGFSLKKIACDLLMLPKALRMARENKYDLVHAVEESVFMAMLIRRKCGIPYVFDMDSSMPEQIADKLPFMRPFLPLMNRCENAAIRNALAVVPMCDSLAERARKSGAARTVVLRDISLLENADRSPQQDLRQELNIRGTCFLYLGNLERYQGIDLLLKSFAILLRSTEQPDGPQPTERETTDYDSHAASRGTDNTDVSRMTPRNAGQARLTNSQSVKSVSSVVKSSQGNKLLTGTRDAHLVIAGGTYADIRKYRSLAGEMGISAAVHFIGPKPLKMMASLFENADVLVSPRSKGQNTPMKIYSYLDSGKAILATRIPSHTQVLNDEVAILAPPEPEEFAKGMKRLADDENLRREIGERARKLAREKYSLSVFEKTVHDLYDGIRQSLAGKLQESK